MRSRSLNTLIILLTFMLADSWFSQFSIVLKKERFQRNGDEIDFKSSILSPVLRFGEILCFSLIGDHSNQNPAAKSPLNASKTCGRAAEPAANTLGQRCSSAFSLLVPPFTPGFSTNSAAPRPQVEINELVTLHTTFVHPSKRPGNL